MEGLCPDCVIRISLAAMTSEERAPRFFGDYELLDEIAHGGMGVVYRARQISLNRVVALKMIRAGLLADDAAVRRFRAEAEAAASLDHPNIVPIYDVGECAGQHYFTMKLTEGARLVDWASREGCWTTGGLECWTAVARLAAKAARAMEHAHQRGILHRDLKPGNILLDDGGEPHVSDFGLAKRTESELDLTLSGTMLGTPSYMSPEAASGHAKQITTASDVYSLGAILYELLTGTAPFGAATAVATLRQVIDEPPRRPRSVNPRADRELEIICLKCLEKDPARRYVSAAALAEDLERKAKGEPILASRASPPEMVWQWCRRNPATAGLTTALIMLFLAGFVLVLMEWRRADAEAEKDRQRLVRMNVVAGLRSAEDGDLASALPCLVEALRLDESNPAKSAQHRTRIAAALRQAPRLTQLWTHDAGVNDAEFSPGGQRAISASSDGTARVWDVRSGQALGQVIRTGSSLDRAIFSPDGKLVATADSAGKIGFWQADTGQSLPSPIALATRLNCIVFSPDSRWLAAAYNDHTARLWDVRTGQQRGPPLTNSSDVKCVCFSPDGRFLAISTVGGTAELWRTDTGEPTGVVLRHHDYIRTVAFSRDGRRIVTACQDGTAQVWDTLTGAPHGAQLRHPVAVFCAEFSPDGSKVATGSDDGTARVWDAETGQATSPPLVHSETVKQVTFSPDSRLLLTASDDHTARVWDAATGALFFSPLWHGNIVNRATFSPDGKSVLTASMDGTARLWSLELAAPETTNSAKRAWLMPGPGKVVTSSGSAVQIWKAARGGRPLQTLSAAGVLQTAAINPDGKRLLLGWEDGHAQVWDLGTGQMQSQFIHTKVVKAVRWRPDGQAVVSAGGDEIAQEWNPDTGIAMVPAFSHKQPVSCVAFSPDGRRIATGSDDGTCGIWDSFTGARLAPLLVHSKDLESICFSPDGQRVLTASCDGTARVWVAATGAECTPPMRHGNWVTEAIFSPDGTKTMTASDDGTARVWDAATGAPLTAPLWLGHGVFRARFSRDGRRVLAENYLCVQVWDSTTGEPLTPRFTAHTILLDAWFSDDASAVLAMTPDRGIVAWDITPIDWPLADLDAVSRLLTSRRVDGQGTLVPLDQALRGEQARTPQIIAQELRRDWERLRASHPEAVAPFGP
jgi:WD40 repeat protein/tRNA A-37 threonylcarbamoyl transferase component Bud32